MNSRCLTLPGRTLKLGCNGQPLEGYIEILKECESLEPATVYQEIEFFGAPRFPIFGAPVLLGTAHASWGRMFPHMYPSSLA